MDKDLYMKIQHSGLTEEQKSRRERYLLSKCPDHQCYQNWFDREQLFRNLFFMVRQEIKTFEFRAQYDGTGHMEKYELNDFRCCPQWFEDLYHPDYHWKTPELWRNVKRAVILYNKRRPHVLVGEFLQKMADRCWQ